jgi:hypothetical protein
LPVGLHAVLYQVYSHIYGLNTASEPPFMYGCTMLKVHTGTVQGDMANKQLSGMYSSCALDILISGEV